MLSRLRAKATDLEDYKSDIRMRFEYSIYKSTNSRLVFSLTFSGEQFHQILTIRIDIALIDIAFLIQKQLSIYIYRRSGSLTWVIIAKELINNFLNVALLTKLEYTIVVVLYNFNAEVVDSLTKI